MLSDSDGDFEAWSDASDHKYVLHKQILRQPLKPGWLALHPRNPYADPSLFNVEDLAHRHPELYEFIISNADRERDVRHDELFYSCKVDPAQEYSLEFSKPEAINMLTEILLQREFGLKVPMLQDRMCPQIPNRYDYILALQDILADREDARAKLLALNEKYPFENDGENADSARSKRLKSDTEAVHDGDSKSVLTLDIGTGAYAIYPLLGCCADSASREACPSIPSSQWHFIATDVDKGSIQNASKILENADRLGTRGLSSRIAPVLATKDSSLIPKAKELMKDQASSAVLSRTGRAHEGSDDDIFDFTMCNPPLLSSAAEFAEDHLATVLYHPYEDWSHTWGEIIYTDRGERGFVDRMVSESIARESENGNNASPWRRSTWYTTVISRKSTIDRTVVQLTKNRVENWIARQIKVGGRPRWLFAWNFGPVRLKFEHPWRGESSLSLSEWHSSTTFQPTVYAWKNVTVRYYIRENTLVDLPNARNIDVVRGAAVHHVEVVLRSLRGVFVMPYEDHQQSSTAQDHRWLIAARQDTWQTIKREKRIRGALWRFEKADIARAMSKPHGAEGPQESRGDAEATGSNSQVSLERRLEEYRAKKSRRCGTSHNETETENQDATDSSRTRKKRAERDAAADVKPWLLVAELNLETYKREDRPDEVIRLQMRWLYGKDHSAFESIVKCIVTRLGRTRVIPPPSEDKGNNF